MNYHSSSVTSTLFIALYTLSVCYCQNQPPIHPQSSNCWRGQAENCLQRVKEIAQSMQTNSPSTLDTTFAGTPVLGTTRVSEKCDLMRGSLRCILEVSGACFLTGMRFDETLFLASSFLRQHCDTSYHWSRMFCYTNDAMRQCETYLPSDRVSTVNASSVCPRYYTFFSCAMERIATCPQDDQTHQAVYFLDKTKDAAWQCGSNVNLFAQSGMSNQRYPMNSYQHQSTYGNTYDTSSYNRPPYINPSYPNYPSYPTGNEHIFSSNSNYGSSNTFGSPPLNPSYSSNGMYPSNQGASLSPGSPSIYPNNFPYNQQEQRPFTDNQFSLFPGDSCIDKASSYARNLCEDEFRRRKVDVQYARTAFDQKRKSCCSLYALQDCLRRTLVSMCREAPPSSIDMLMGPSRTSEMTMTCNDHPSYYCNGASHAINSTGLALVCVLIALYLHSSLTRE